MKRVPGGWGEGLPRVRNSKCKGLEEGRGEPVGETEVQREEEGVTRGDLDRGCGTVRVQCPLGCSGKPLGWTQPSHVFKGSLGFPGATLRRGQVEEKEEEPSV